MSDQSIKLLILTESQVLASDQPTMDLVSVIKGCFDGFLFGCSSYMTRHEFKALSASNRIKLLSGRNGVVDIYKVKQTAKSMVKSFTSMVRDTNIPVYVHHGDNFTRESIQVNLFIQKVMENVNKKGKEKEYPIYPIHDPPRMIRRSTGFISAKLARLNVKKFNVLKQEGIKKDIANLIEEKSSKGLNECQYITDEELTYSSEMINDLINEDYGVSIKRIDGKTNIKITWSKTG